MKSLTSGENTVYFVPSSDAVESIEINLVSQRRAMHGGSRDMDGDCGEAGQNEKQKRLPPPKENRRIPNHSPGDWMRDDDFSWWGKKHSQFDSVSGCGTLGAAWCPLHPGSRRGTQCGTSRSCSSIVPNNSQFNPSHRMPESSRSATPSLTTRDIPVRFQPSSSQPRPKLVRP
jgi:hypothetical protein